MRLTHRAGTLILAVTAVAVTACSADPTPATEAAPGGGDTTLTVVASTNVWAAVASAVAGDAATVTGLIDDPSADPHSYEATPSDAAAVLDASLVVFNGGGYDEWMSDVLATPDATDTRTVEAFAVSGREEGSNEHVWYDLAAVQRVADTIAEQLGALDPQDAAMFTANADAFTAQVRQIAATTADIAATSRGQKVEVTEPIADLLLADAGLDNVSPEEFVEAVEEETDPPADAVAQAQDLATSGDLAALVYNPQAASPVTESVRTAARGAGVPVVEMTETLPADTGYIAWMTAQVAALRAAIPTS